MDSKNKKNVSVVVLGDIGRSPRMQYHSLSFANNDCNVDIIGYGGSTPLEELVSHPNVNIKYLKEYPSFYCPKLIDYILKTIWQTFMLLFALVFKRRSHYVIVQNPPAIPSLYVCWFYCFLTKAKLIIDWHNYANSIMALTLGPKHIIVKIATWIEFFFGSKSSYNLCVTEAMKNDLSENKNIKAKVLYDRPHSQFQPISLSKKHEFIKRLSKKYPVFGSLNDLSSTTAFTEIMEDGSVKLKQRRKGLIVSSTSWTEDEDFSILLTGLEEYEKHCSFENDTKLPDLICAITGRGPLKEYYCDLISKKNWQHVSVITPWLETKDYPLLLASADLGVCLHTSSSGLDLPMKVVDMFGCGLPVCAYNFKCLKELVKNNINGYTFNDSTELSEQIKTWFIDFPNNKHQRKIVSKFQNELKNFQQNKWAENWNEVILPILNSS